MPFSRVFRPVYGAVDGLIDRVLCVLGAVLFSQMPEFMQQYVQRLGGHLDEARRQLAQFKDVATKSGLTLDQLIANTATNADPAVVRLGGVVSEAVTRVDHLAAAEMAIRDASLWTRPFVFFSHFDGSIGRAAWAAFKPAVPTTVEGLVYAGLGVLLFLAVYQGGVRYPIVRYSRRRELAKESKRLAAKEPVRGPV